MAPKRRLKKSRKRGWRVSSTYSTGQAKTIPYTTKKAAVAAADRELTYGAVEVEVWNEEDG